MGHLSPKRLRGGGLGEGFRYWETRKMRFLRDTQNALYAGLPLYRGPFWGTWRGSVFQDFERNE
jgi:hypothetical protein